MCMHVSASTAQPAACIVPSCAHVLLESRQPLCKGECNTGVMWLCRIYWMNPLQYAQKAIIINEFSGGELLTPLNQLPFTDCFPFLCVHFHGSCVLGACKRVCCCTLLHQLLTTDCFPCQCVLLVVFGCLVPVCGASLGCLLSTDLCPLIRVSLLSDS